MLSRRNVSLTIVALAALVLGLIPLTATSIQAQEKKNDVTGTWKWSQEGMGQQMEFTLKLKQDGDKLTGTLGGGFDQSEAAIQDGKVKDGEISFKVTRDFGGNPIVTTYTGKVSGDSFKGKSELVITNTIDAKRGS
jgi:hypothetical protein